MQHRVINKILSYESPPGPPLYTNNTIFVKNLNQLNFNKSCPNQLDHYIFYINVSGKYQNYYSV